MLRTIICPGVSLVLAALMLTGTAAAAPERDLMSDTWTATDALGRTLPGYRECGPPKPDRTVGIFYFLWHGQHGTSGPHDITKILTANPDKPAWGPPGAFHHWGEPETGYYIAGDPYIYRRHARMLAMAGVDVLVVDVTNGFTYREPTRKLFETLRQLRRAGERTPQICFLANSGSDNVVRTLYADIYSRNLYPELWFRWQGKPLMLAKPDTLPPDMKAFFTFRQSWAWSDPRGWFGDGRDKWPWLDNHPQAFGWHTPGVPEQVSVTVAQHPTSDIGRSFHDGKQPPPAEQRPEAGLCFDEQIRRALDVDPTFVFITGWNEWVAQRFVSDGGMTFLGRRLPKGETFFVDAYTQEYSRDIEPMKGGHTDSYYYQMAAFIRRYKGVRRPPAASAPKTIRVDGRFEDWNGVGPEYRDVIGDAERRNSAGWGRTGLYTNSTGRNDFTRLKVARDARSVSFYAETAAPIAGRTGLKGMLLFIDADRDAKTGWQGYDLRVTPASATEAAVERRDGGNWKPAGRVPYRVKANRMELQVPRRLLGQAARRVAFDFHWVDNMQKPDDIMEFAVSGDSAPDRRFNYRYDTEPAK